MMRGMWHWPSLVTMILLALLAAAMAWQWRVSSARLEPTFRYLSAQMPALNSPV